MKSASYELRKSRWEDKFYL